MPEEKTRRAVERDKREGKSASTQAGEHVREGKHGVQNTKQAIAIGLSKARRAGIDVEPGDNASPAVKKKARKDIAKGRKTATKRPAAKRSAGAKKALKTTSKTTAKKAVSRTALSKQAKKAASKRTAADRSAAAKKAARTKGPAKRSAAAKKAARTRKKAS
jgi:translation elongation factor EF-1alpha